MRLFASLLAGVTLAVGFGVAQVTGNRPVGGVVLVIGAIICGFQWWQSSGKIPAIACVAVFLVAFAVSHPLAKQIGAWPSVEIVAIATAAFTYFIARPRRTEKASVEK